MKVHLGFVCLVLCLTAAPLTASAQGGLKWSMLMEKAGIGTNSAVEFHGSLYVCSPDANVIWSSLDGKQWFMIDAPDNAYNDHFVVFNDTLLGFGYNIWASADGYAWSHLNHAPWTSYYSLPFYQIAELGGKLWCFTQDGQIWRSSDGSAWQKVVGTAPWASRTDFNLVAFNNKLWVLGGKKTSDNTLLNDIWSTTDGSHWTKVVPTAPWSPRSQFACVVNAGKIWLLGGAVIPAQYSMGQNSGQDINDVWSSSDGLTWTRDPGKVSWGPRHGHSAVSLDGVIYLIGGRGWSGQGDAPTNGYIEERSVYASIDNHHDATVVGGLTYSVERRADALLSLTVKNTGTAAWTGRAGYRLNLLSCNLDNLWTAGTNDLPLPAGATVAPGQSYTFSIPLNTANMFDPARLNLQMYSPDTLYFGDDIDLTITPLPVQNLTWKRVTPIGFDTGQTSQVLTFNGRLWANNQYTTDGVHWAKAGDPTKAPWAGRRGQIMTVFKDKLWLLGGLDNQGNSLFDVWTSADGFTWRKSSKDRPADYYGNFQSLVFKDKLWWLDYSYYGDNAYTTTDGQSWQFFQASDDMIGPWIVFKNMIWSVGGYDGYTSYHVTNSIDGYSSAYGADLPAARSDIHDVVFHNQLWVLGGRDDSGKCQTTVWFTDDGNSWQPANPLPFDDATGYTRLKAVVYNDQIWLFVYRADTVEIWRGSPSPALTTSATWLDLGARDILAGWAPSQTLSIFNRGSAPLTLQGWGAELLGSQAGHFRVNGVNPSVPIPAGGRRDLTVSFDPDTVGETSATLRITAQGPYTPTVDVALTGRGTTTRNGRYAGILEYLLGLSSDKTNLDLNTDGTVTVADLLLEGKAATRFSNPLSGSTWAMGSTHSIKWTPDAAAGSKVDIKLYRNHAPYQDIVAATANDGQYDWAVPYGVIPASDYTIAVISSSKPTIAGESPSFMTIASAAATITVKSPNGGERWMWGDPREIRWSAPAGVATVRLSVYKGGQYLKTIDDTPNDGSYTWYVPADLEPDVDYQICISDVANRNVRDAGNSMFSIVGQ